MPNAKHYARIAITLPDRDLAAADRLARQLDRPRSWVIAEAVRRFAAHPDQAPPAARAPLHVAEPAVEYGVETTGGLGPQRLEQLRRDMQLTPEQRVREAEETLRLDEIIAARDRKPRADRIMTFAQVEDYVDWKRHRDRQP